MKRFTLSFLIFTLTSAPAWAANESREKQMLRRIQQQVQQIDQARTLAEAEKAAALADKDTAERELEKIRSGVATSKHQLATERAARTRIETEQKAVQSENDVLKKRLADTEVQLAASAALQRVTAQMLAQVESAKKRTEGELSGKANKLQVCQAHNGQLYAMGREMMQKYRDKSCQDALAQAEPFTGLKKVEVENLLEIWRDRLDRETLSVQP